MLTQDKAWRRVEIEAARPGEWFAQPRQSVDEPAICCLEEEEPEAFTAQDWLQLDGARIALYSFLLVIAIGLLAVAVINSLKVQG